MIDLNGMILRPEYQQPIHDVSIKYCKESNKPVVVSASVGSGKTLSIAALAKHTSNKGGRVLVLARQGELIEQNSKMAWKCGLKNSVYSASLFTKSTFYPVVMGTEGTVSGALTDEFKDSKFDLMLIDECLTGDSKIKTTQGEIKIKDLTNDHLVYCLNESSGELTKDKPLRVFSNGIRYVSRFKTTNGDVKCTLEHKIFVNGCWIQAKELKVGQMTTQIDLLSKFHTRTFRAIAAVLSFLALKVKGMELI